MAPRRKPTTTRTIAAMEKTLREAEAEARAMPAKSRRKPQPKEFTQAEFDAAFREGSSQGFGDGYDRCRTETAFEARQREMLATVEAVEMMPGPADTMLLAAFSNGRQNTILSVTLGQLRTLARGLRTHWGFPSLVASNGVSEG